MKLRTKPIRGSSPKPSREGAVPLAEGDGKVILEIGANKWPFPIPLVKENSAWRFDTAAGKEEIINRHIGKDEFHAIAVCEAYVPAQKQYAAGVKGPVVQYAQHMSQLQSPFGTKMAEAGVDGGSRVPKPFHGYFFRILTGQGAAAPGGAMGLHQKTACSPADSPWPLTRSTGDARAS